MAGFYAAVDTQAGENVPNLEALEADGDIIFIPLGGSCLALWADRLQALNRPEIHICDRDNPPDQEPKYAAHVAAVNARDGCTAHTTTKREMENYIHPNAIFEAYQANGVELALPPTFQDFDDVPQIVAQALHAANSPTSWDDLSEEQQKKKASKAKKVINGEAARRMSVVRLNECGGYDEVLAWLQNIKNLIDA